VPCQSAMPPEWGDGSHATSFPNATSRCRPQRRCSECSSIHSTTPGQSRRRPRGKLALDVPDLLPAGEPLEVGCEVAEGDPEVPLLIRLEALDGGGWTDCHSPKLGRRPRELLSAAGARRLPCAGCAGLRMPDVLAAWGLLPVVDSQLYSSPVD